MSRYPGARSLRAVQGVLSAIVALAAAPAAFAQTSLVTATHTVVAQGQPLAVEHNFTVTNAGKYSVVLLDFGSYLLAGSSLTSVSVAVTQGAAIVGTPVSVVDPQANAPSITFNATANTTYAIHIVGIPGTAASGAIEEGVFDSSGNEVFKWDDTLSVPSQQPGAIGFLAETITPSSLWGGFITMQDFGFPATLANAYIEVFDTTQGISLLTKGGFGSWYVNMTPGDTYVIVAVAQERSGAAGGLFSVFFTLGGGETPPFGPKLVPVGGVKLLQTFSSGQPQPSFRLGPSSATLVLTDLSFPTVPLSSAGTALVDVTQPQLALTVTAPGKQTLSTPVSSDTYQVYGYAVPDSTATDGSYSVVVQQGTAFPFVAAQAVSSSTTTQAFSLVSRIPIDGPYVLTLTDFKFPVQLTSDALAAVQNGQLVKSIDAAGNFSATLSQGPVTLLAFGAEGGQPASPGLMGIDLSPAGGGAAVFDATEGIGAGFSATTFTAQSAQAVQANVADLKFPAALANLNLAVTSGTTLVGTMASVGSSGNFAFQTAANATYTVNVLATPPTPSNSQQGAAGTYAVSVDSAPPVVTLEASSGNVRSGGTVTLTWTASNATSCTASASPSNAAWSASESPSGGPVTSSAITATTTFSLSCTGNGGTANASATVTVSTASGGGGSIDPGLLLMLGALLALRARAALAGERKTTHRGA